MNYKRIAVQNNRMTDLLLPTKKNTCNIGSKYGSLFDSCCIKTVGIHGATSYILFFNGIYSTHFFAYKLYLCFICRGL